MQKWITQKKHHFSYNNPIYTNERKLELDSNPESGSYKIEWPAGPREPLTGWAYNIATREGSVNDFHRRKSFLPIEAQGVILKTPLRKATLGVYQKRSDGLVDPTSQGYSTISVINIFDTGVPFRYEPRKSGDIGAQFMIDKNSDVTLSFGGYLPEESDKYQKETDAQKALYESLGLTSLIDGRSIVSGERAPLEPETIHKLTDFLLNQVAANIKPGIENQLIEISFGNTSSK